MEIIHRYIGDRDFYRRVFTVLVPILVQNLITNFVSLLDNLMVGQVGTEPMSGVAIVNQLLFVFNLCVFGGISGAGILTAQYYGKGDRKGLQDSVRVKLWLSLAILLVFGSLLKFRGTGMIDLFLHEGESGLDLALTERHAAEYLNVMMVQLLPFALTTVYAGTLRETGETLLPMKAGLIAVLINLVLNYILIFGKLGLPAMGVVGAAVATVIARFAEAGIVVGWSHLHRERNAFLTGLYRSLRVPREILGKVLVLGLPLMLNELLWSGGMTVLNQCYSLRGLEVVSALNISTTAANLFFSAFISTGSAIAIMVGQLLGAGELERAVDENRKLIFFSLVLSLCIGTMQALAAPLIPRIYNTIPEVRRIAEGLLLINAAMMPMHAIANSCYFTLRSGGKALITFLFDSGIMWTISIPTAFVLSRFTAVPILPMFAAVEGTNLIKCVIGLRLVHRRRWVVNLVSGRQESGA